MLCICYSLNHTVGAVERRCDELQAHVEQLKRDARQKSGEKRTHRTWSVPALNDDDYTVTGRRLPFTVSEFLGMPSFNDSVQDKRHERHKKEIKELKETVRILKLQYSTEQKMKCDVEQRIDDLKHDNNLLLDKSKLLEDELERQKELYAQALEETRKQLLQRQGIAPGREFPLRSLSITGSELGDNELRLEHDIDEKMLPKKEVVRLKCGGSAYGSRESLNQIGLEAITSTLETCSDILVDAVQRNPSTTDSPSPSSDQQSHDIPPPDPENTLLGELEEQYRRLVKKYESLIDAKSKRGKNQGDDVTKTSQNVVEEAPAAMASNGVKLRRPKSMVVSREVQTAWRKSTCALDLTSPVDPVEGCFQRGPPEYKKLFREIFETLKKSAEFDDQLSPKSD